jgi:stalled ribosome rescue protein Dom34
LGNSFFSFEKKKQHRKEHVVQKYLKRVINEIKDFDEIVMFGPGQMKTELEKNIRHEPSMISTIKMMKRPKV